MNLINEYKERSYFKMPGSCNSEFQSLMRQIGDYCKLTGKGNEYRVPGLFVVQFLLNRHIITYGENRDLTVYYSMTEAVDAIKADRVFITTMGPIPRNTANIKAFEQEVPEVNLPSAEWDHGSSIGQDRPAPVAKRHTTLVNTFVADLIKMGRFNCDHVDDFKNYAHMYLRGYNTQFQRGGLEGQQFVDKGGYEIPGKKVELKDFVFNPNYNVTYATAKSLNINQPQAVYDKELLLKNPDIVYLFFVTYFIPTFISIYTDNDTTVISDILLTTNSIREFEEKLESERKRVNTLRLKELTTGGDETEELENLEDQIKLLKYFISNVEDFKNHTREYVFGVDVDKRLTAREEDTIKSRLSYKGDEDEDIFNQSKPTNLTPTPPQPSVLKPTALTPISKTKKIIKLTHPEEEDFFS